MLKRGNHLIRKIDWALQQEGITPEELRRLTGVKSKSAVSEWRRTGRIAKGHLPLLATRTGTTERWWLSENAPVPPSGEWLSQRNAASPIHKPEPGSSVGQVLHLAPRLSADAQALGWLFDLHEGDARRRVWKRAVEVLASSADLRLAFSVPPSEAPAAEDFGDKRRRAGYEGLRGTKQPKKR